MSEEALDTVFGDCPVEPKSGEGEGHGGRHVQVRITAPQEGTKSIVGIHTWAAQLPADGAHSGNQPEPVREKNEDENRPEEPERPLHKMFAEDAFEEIV